MYKKIDAYVLSEDDEGIQEYVYFASSNFFKSCKEFKARLSVQFPDYQFKCNFNKG